MSQFLIATRNPDKLKEYRKLLNDSDLDLVDLEALGIQDRPEDNGLTFEDNAIRKAKYYFAHSGLPTLADDGGLEIAALNGQPGLAHRARHEQMPADDVYAEIINQMQEIPEGSRAARLNLVIAVASPYGTMTSQASVDGVLANKPSRKRLQGHLYSPLVYIPNYGKYYADLDTTELEILNHRKAALDKIRDFILLLK